MRIRYLFLLLLFFSISYTLYPRPFYADTIYKNDGGELKGIVVEDYKDRLVFSTPDGELALMKSDIRELRYDTEEDNLIKLAEQARDRRDYTKSYGYYELASRINPNSKAAQDGKIFLQGYLFRKEQAQKEENVKRQDDFERYGTIIETDKAAEEKFKESAANLRKRFGITLKEEAGQAVIETIDTDSPAYSAGLQKGDVLVAVWGRLTGYMPLQDVMDILLDKPSLEVKCVIERTRAVEKGGAVDIGSSFSMEFDGLTVSGVNEGGPAFTGGVRKFDLVTAIDGKPTRYMPLKKAIEMMRDPKTASVKLTLRRETTIWRKGD